MTTQKTATTKATASTTADTVQTDTAATTKFAPSGAPEQTVTVPADHPAVDTTPREGTTAEMNRIDFNDPPLSGQEAVERALQGGK